MAKRLFHLTLKTRSFVYGTCNQSSQGMLDFDFMCKRESHPLHVWWSIHSEASCSKVLLRQRNPFTSPYSNVAEAVAGNFQMFGSVTLHHVALFSMVQWIWWNNSIKTIALIAGVPEKKHVLFCMKLMPKRFIGLQVNDPKDIILIF
jgi:hypothetical protein